MQIIAAGKTNEIIIILLDMVEINYKCAINFAEAILRQHTADTRHCSVTMILAIRQMYNTSFIISL